jgi:hypothetical protein
MSTESSKSPLSFIELFAILVFIVGIVFIFVSKQGSGEREKELRNAVRFQDVSLLADAIWKVSLSSTDYASLVEAVPTDISCEASSVSVDVFSPLLIPAHFETIPQDPSGEAYRFSLDSNKYITVCTNQGEGEDGALKLISITR